MNKDFLELTVQIARALRILEVHIPDAVGNLFIADITLLDTHTIPT